MDHVALRPNGPTIRAARFQPEGGSSWSASSDVTDGDLPPAGGMCHVRSNGLLVEKSPRADCVGCFVVVCFLVVGDGGDLGCVGVQFVGLFSSCAYGFGCLIFYMCMY